MRVTSRNSRRVVARRQKTATNIRNLNLPTRGSMKRLTLAVPELHSVAKQATDAIC